MRRVGRILGWVFALALFVAVAGALAGAAFVWSSLERLSRSDLLADVTLEEPLRIYSAEGLLMGEFGTQRRLPVPYEAIPKTLIQAFLAAEDSRFYEHPGVDLRGLSRAALSYLRTGEPAQGGSTLTMQVVRNLVLTPEKTFERKLTEVLMALHLERVLTKEEILTLYLNKIFFGHRAYGVAAAADLYYGKTLGELSLAEHAMLAGIPKAPTTDNPVTNPARALERRDYVLGRMLELGMIDEAAYRRALAEPDRAGLHRHPVELDAGYPAEMARQEVLRLFGDEAYRRGLRVVTTLSSELQAAAQGAVRKAILAYDHRHGYRGPERRGLPVDAATAALDALLGQTDALPLLRAGIVTQADSKRAEVYLGGGEKAILGLKQVQWARPFKESDLMGRTPSKVTDVVQPGDLLRLDQDGQGGWELAQRPSVAAALLAIAPQDGAIRAVVGGYHFGASQFNRATDARRQPGSAFKPFVYGAALERGWTPASIVLDEPVSVRVGPGDLWEPANADRRTLGPVRLRLALTQSRNLASIDLLDRVGIDVARQFAARLGFESSAMPRGLTLALGTGSVTLEQMAGAYAVFANGGFRVAPYLIARVEDGAGRVVWQAGSPQGCNDCRRQVKDKPVGPRVQPALDPRLAYQMHSMLQGVIRSGTGRRARALGRSDLAGKTGTTNDARDAWFCGYQKDLVAISWMGFDDYSPLGKGESGGKSALGLWVRFMREALKDTPESPLPVPAGLVQVPIDGATGNPAATGDPGAIMEWLREEDAGWQEGPVPAFSSWVEFDIAEPEDSIIESVQ